MLGKMAGNFRVIFGFDVIHFLNCPIPPARASGGPTELMIWISSKMKGEVR
jgi:hypothetical protein